MSGHEVKEAYQAGRRNGNRIDAQLLSSLGWDKAQILDVLSVMVEKRLCFLRPTEGTAGRCVCVVRDLDVAQRLSSLTEDEYKVYCAVERAGDQGIWTADIRKATHLTGPALQRCVKQLEDNKRLVKPVKSIHQRQKKIYILAHLQPAKGLAGGTFYEDGEFNEALVERIRLQILHVVRHGTRTNFKDIHSYVRSLGLGVDLAEADVRRVLTTLEVDQVVQSGADVGGDVVYTASHWHESLGGAAAAVPCGGCPLFRDCTRGTVAHVDPETCLYLRDFIDNVGKV
eukprot:Polyplicarium_translucidae@DN312_c0_g1_i1.p1